MYNSDIDTTQKMRKLEKELKQLYSDAYARLTAESERYFDEFEDRYEKQYEAFKQGKYTKQEFDAWYMNQVARGERWESLRDDMARKVTQANVEAARLINGVTPEVFLTNYNWSAYEAEKASGIAFNIYNQSTVEELLKDEPKLLPKKGINIPKDVEWNKKKLSNAVVSGILTGKGIDQISKSFGQVTDMNWAAAVRNARTAVTSAQNAGRQKNMEDVEEFAKSNGLKTQKEWVSAHDGRVRDSHAELDGVRVDIDEEFPNGLMYPADPQGAPAEVYNCRCAQRLVIDGVVANRTDKTKETYNEWLKDKEIDKKLVYTGGRILDPNSEDATAWAEQYYEEIRHKSTDYKKIAARLGMEESQVKAIKDYVFTQGTWYNKYTGMEQKFGADAAICQSWQRLAEAKKIYPHDITLIKHEEYEMQIKADNPSMSHTVAHTLATQKYNYQKEVEEFYGSIRERKKRRK